ncbi:hypothetical protein ZOSMA_55G00770 [Zostera marina]|uniref:Uncharacterized protein n=1 Tax=Zostera marina TaxID=29655 RepID=A0A0K9NYK4_ZOSMR|nr:hypothetical protein ZOSMA_55G00770 [Zostera marina]
MVVGTPGQNDHFDDQYSDHHDVDMNTTECSKKKSQSQKKDHLQHHPKQGSKFKVIFEDDEIVYDKAAEKLKKKMNMVANDFKLLSMNAPWSQQDETNTKKAIETIQVNY